MQQQLEVTHREALNTLTTIKLAAALITNSNCEYFLDEILKLIMPGCADPPELKSESSLLLTGLSAYLP